MINTDLERFRNAWKENESFSKDTLSERSIHLYMMKTSKDVVRMFIKGIQFDLVLKAILLISFVILLFLYPHQPSAMVMATIGGLVSLWGFIFQFCTLGKIPGKLDAEDAVRQTLNSRLNYYNRYHIRSTIVGSLTNALIIISGMFFYFYFEYGKIRPLEIHDILVLGALPVIGFISGAFIQFRHHRFHIRQIENLIKDIDAARVTEGDINLYRQRRKRLVFIYMIAFITGMLVFLYFAFR